MVLLATTTIAVDSSVGERGADGIPGNGLRINEVVSRNVGLLSDADGSQPDLIEMFNAGPAAIDLEGYGLSDDPSIPLKWTFPRFLLEPGEYLLVLAAKPGADVRNEAGHAASDLPQDAASDHPQDTDSAPPQNAASETVPDSMAKTAVLPEYPNGRVEVLADETAGSTPAGTVPDHRQTVSVLKAGFGLSHRGDRLSLSDPEGRRLQVLLLDASPSDCSYGRNTAGENVWFARGTPGRINGGVEIHDMKAFRKGCTLTASHVSGRYPETFPLALSCDRPELTIRYTRDGRVPDGSSPVYQSPLPITDREGERYALAGKPMTYAPVPKPPRDAVGLATVLTAQAFDGDTPIGPPLVRTFFITPDGKEPHALPIVSLTANPDDLLDDTYGIFAVGSHFQALAPDQPDGGTPANYNQRGREWERPLHMEYLEDGVSVFSQALGVRTFGAWSRAEVKKTMRLIARSEYTPGTDVMAHPFFPGLVDDRGEGITRFHQLVLRNGGNDWNTTLFRDPMMQGLATDVPAKQASRPVIVYLNGEYWGIYFLTESLDADWVEAHHGASADSVGIVANGGELYEGTQADLEAYQDLMAFLEKTPLQSDDAFSQVAARVDVEAYLRYQAAQIYFGNLDWPGNNIRMYRVRPGPGETDTSGKAAASPTSGSSGTTSHAVSDGRWRPMLFDTDFGFGLYEDLSDVTHDTLWLAMDPVGKDWPNPPWSTLLFRRLMENPTCRRQFVDIMASSMKTRYASQTVLDQIRSWQDLLAPEMAAYAKRYPLWRIPDVGTWQREGVARLEAYARLRPHQIQKQLARHLGDAE